MRRISRPPTGATAQQGREDNGYEDIRRTECKLCFSVYGMTEDLHEGTGLPPKLVNIVDSNFLESCGSRNRICRNCWDYNMRVKALKCPFCSVSTTFDVLPQTHGANMP